MSTETPSPPSSPPAGPLPPNAPASKRKRTRREKWRRRFFVLVTLLVLVALTLRVLLHVLFPIALDRAAQTFGLHATYDKLDLSLLSTDAGIWGLRITPIEGGEPVLSTYYCRGAISTWDLFKLHLQVKRVEADDAQLLLERLPDGSLPLLQRLLAATTSKTPPATKPASANATPSLAVPLQIDALRLQNVSLRLRDAMMTPATDVTMQLDLLVRDIGLPNAPAQIELQLHSPQALSALYVTGTAGSTRNQVTADVRMTMVGLNLRPALAYLAPLGVVPHANDLSASAHAVVQATVLNPPTTRPTTRPAGTLQASLALDDISLTADSVPAASVRRVDLAVREISPGAIRVEQVDIQGVRVVAMRTAQHTASFAGIEFGVATPVAPATPTIRPTTQTAAAGASSAPVIELDQIGVRDVSFQLTDRAMTPPQSLTINLDRLLLTNFSTDPATAARPAKLSLVGRAPDLAEHVAVEGELVGTTPAKTAKLQIEIGHLTATALAPYLKPLGIESTMADGHFACKLDVGYEPRSDGSQHVALNLADVRLDDGDQSLFVMPRVALRDASFDPARNRIRLGDVELNGPTLPIRRDPDRSVAAFGFRVCALQPSVTEPSQPSATPPAATRPTWILATLPTLEIGKLVWRGCNLHLDDATVGEPPLQVAIDDVQANIDDLILGADGSAKPGKLSFAMRAPGLVDAFEIAGTVSPAAGSVGFGLHGKMDGLTLDRVRSLLNGIGVDPTWQAAQVRFDTAGSLHVDDAGTLHADVHVRDTALRDGSTDWLGVAGADVTQLTFDGRGLHVGSIRVDAPTATVRRDEAGLLTVAGVKLLPPKQRAVARAPVVVAVRPAPVTPTQLDLTLPIVVGVDTIDVTNASLHWQDGQPLPAVDLIAAVDAHVTGLVVGEAASPASFNVSLAAPGVVDRLSLQGSLSAAPHAQMLKATVHAAGLDGHMIEPYLPPTIGVDLAKRTCNATLAADLAPNDAGGSRGNLVLRDGILGSADGVIIDAGIRSAQIAVDRVDLPAGVLALDTLAVEGLNAAGSQDEVGLHVLGVTIANHPLRQTRPPQPASQPVAGDTLVEPGSLARAAAEQSLPSITVNHLSLSTDRLSFRTPALALPLTISHAAVTNVAPIALGGGDAQEKPPIRLHAVATVENLVRSATLDVTAAPFARDPTATWSFDASEIQGDGLTAFVPALAQRLSAHDLEDARFTTSGEAHVAFTRRGPLGVDLTRDLTGELIVHETTLSAPLDPRPLFGVGEVHVDKIRVSPSTGSVVVGLLDVAKPIASAIRDRDGVHVVGIVLPILQPATTRPATEPSSQPAMVATAVPPAEPAALPVARADTSANDLRIDRLTVSGVDFRIEDRVNEPHTLIPVTDLNVEVIGLTKRALAEPRPIRFSATVTAGKVPLPPRRPSASGPELEDRDVFAEASASANLTIFPKPSGYVRGSISGLELTAIRGIAKEFGITLGGGTFDGRLDVRMSGGDRFEAKAWPTFDELRASEVPNGPIQRLLRLPSPLDVTIATLQDTDGSITFPLTVPIEAGKIDVGTVVGSAVSSVAKVLSEAIVAAPLKTAKLAGGVFGFDTSSDRTKGVAPIEFTFARGESQLAPDQLSALRQVQQLMLHDPTIEVTIQHELGADDVALADERVNLGIDDSRELAQQLLARKYDLQRRFAEQSAALTASIASGNDAARIELDSRTLRVTATELKLTEDGLDTIFDLQRPGADRQSSRRTKAASILLADLRLRTVQDWLFANVAARDVADRVRRTNALFNAGQQGPGKIRLVLTRRAKS